MIADLQVAHFGADLLDDAAEFMPERLPDARVWDHAVIEGRFDPQMHDRVTFTIASSGRSMTGIGRSPARSSSAHDVLLNRSWSSANMRDVIDASLATFASVRIAE